MECAEPFASVESLTVAILASLNRPPSRIGTRLRPEVDLAQKLNVGRRTIRTSLEKLVQEGILVRRQGSGTFVRKIPNASSMSWSDSQRDPIDPDVLFATPTEDSTEESPLRVNSTKKRLHFSVWTDVHQRSSQLIFAGMVKRANRSGVHVSLHSLTGLGNDPISLAQLGEQLRHDPCDGYVILEPWSDLVEQAIGRIDKPAVYFWGSAVQIKRRSPLVTYDTFAFYRESILWLQQQGYKRIAAVSLRSEPVETMQLSQAFYSGAIASCGLGYHQQVLTDVGISGPYEATRQLLASSEPPDAIVVSDDHLLAGTAEALTVAGKRLGEDFGLISWANTGMPLGNEHPYSVLEYDPGAFGSLVWDVLMRTVQVAGTYTPPISMSPVWKPGTTHLRGNASTGNFKDRKSSSTN